jgi:Arc/MetJ-type ribon-helix-helix transcriptional regulator
LSAEGRSASEAIRDRIRALEGSGMAGLAAILEVLA